MPTQKISTIQAVVFLLNTITPTGILVIPIITIGAAAQDAWMSIIPSWLFSLACVALYCRINRYNPGLPFFEFLEQRLGRFVSVVVGLLLVQYYYGTLAAVVREFINFLSDEIMISTPLFVLGAVTMIIGIYASSQGIEVIARVGVIVFGAAVLFVAIGVALDMDLMSFRRLQPVGEASWNRIVVGSLSAGGWMSEASVLLLIAPFLNKPGAVGKVGFWGVTLSGITLMATVLAVLLVLGPRLPAIMSYPTFAISELIEYGNFVERVDIAFICAWMATVYMKVCIFFFAAMHCFKATFRIRSEKPLRIGLALLILLTALYSWPSNAYLAEHQRFAMTPFLIIMNVLLPLLLWIGIAATGRGRRKREGDTANVEAPSP